MVGSESRQYTVFLWGWIWIRFISPQIRNPAEHRAWPWQRWIRVQDNYTASIINISLPQFWFMVIFSSIDFPRLPYTVADEVAASHGKWNLKLIIWILFLFIEEGNLDFVELWHIQRVTLPFIISFRTTLFSFISNWFVKKFSGCI